MAGLFITSSGTGLGKTYLTAGLARHLREGGHAVEAHKPVISGFDVAEAARSDSGILLEALGRPVTQTEIDRISPWRFGAPLSPDMAAMQESIPIDFDELLAFSKTALAASDNVLIEGAGGVMAPLNRNHTMLDWIAALEIPVALVVGNYLGAISHALTAAAVLRQKDCELRMIVVSESEGATVDLDETAGSISRFARNVGIVALPRNSDAAARDGAFAFIADCCELG